MGDQGTVWLPEGASTIAPEFDSLFYFVYWTSLVIFVGVVVAMAYFAYKYRRQRADERPAPVVENKLMEISWVVIPTILVLIVFTWGFRSFVRMNVAPPNAYEIQVRAQKWAWQFEYPNGVTTTGELHVPADRPVKLRMSSVDVLHSFFVPAFRVKQDVVPDRYTSLWFEATRVDTFQVFCTEYCGTEHSSMLASVVVHPQDAFTTWLEEAGAGAAEDLPLPELGAQLYEQQVCNSCHSLDGAAGVGPSFRGLFGKQETLADGSTVEVDENYLRESILEPGATIVQGYQNVMPPAYGSLSERQVSGLIEFIKEQQ